MLLWCQPGRFKCILGSAMRKCVRCQTPLHCSNRSRHYCGESCRLANYQEKRLGGSSQRRRFAALKRDGFRCQYCGRSIHSHPKLWLELDHVIPKSKGGTDCLENLRTACSECNQGKFDIEL